MALATLSPGRQYAQALEKVTSDWRVAVPAIQAGAVVLREARTADAAALFDLFAAEKVGRFITPPPPNPATFERFIASMHRERAAARAFCLAVVPHGGTSPVGLFQVRATDPGSPVAQWGFALSPDLWGTGVFSDAARAVIEFAFERAGFVRLEARTCVLNGRGNGALAKLGAIREAILRRSFERDGEYFDQALWSIVRQDWRETKGGFRAAVVH